MDLDIRDFFRATNPSKKIAIAAQTERRVYDGLVARACDQLEPFVRQSDHVTDADRAMCNL